MRIKAQRAARGRPLFCQKWIWFSVVGGLAWLVSITASANPYVVVDLLAHNDAVSIDDTVHGWKGSIEDGNKAFTHDWVEIGANYKGIGVGILQRYDFELEYSPDTARFYHLVNNKKPLPTGKQFDLFLAARHTYSKGLRFSYQRRINQRFAFSLGWTYLKGLRLTEGQFKGKATALADNDYDFTADVDYFYSKDVLFERKVDPPDGEGYSIDTSVDWKIWRDLSVHLKVIDLIGRMYWINAPNTTAVASSDVKEYDADGYVKYNPVLSGDETARNFTQKFHPQITLRLSYPACKSIDLIGQAYSIKSADYYQLGGSYYINAANTVRALYMFETNAFTLGYDNKYVQFAITSDSLNINTAHTLGISLTVQVLFF